MNWKRLLRQGARMYSDSRRGGRGGRYGRGGGQARTSPRSGGGGLLSKAKRFLR